MEGAAVQLSFWDRLSNKKNRDAASARAIVSLPRFFGSGYRPTRSGDLIICMRRILFIFFSKHFLRRHSIDVHKSFPGDVAIETSPCRFAVGALFK